MAAEGKSFQRRDNASRVSASQTWGNGGGGGARGPEDREENRFLMAWQHRRTLIRLLAVRPMFWGPC